MDKIDEVVKELGGSVYDRQKRRYIATTRENYIERIRQLVDKEKTAKGNAMVADRNFN